MKSCTVCREPAKFIGQLDQKYYCDPGCALIEGKRGRNDDAMITLVSSDNVKFEISAEDVAKSVTLSNLLDDTNDNEIPVPNVRSEILAKVIEYLKSGEKRQPESLDDSIDILLAANYLEIIPLVKVMMNLIKRESISAYPTPWGIREALGIEETGFSPEETANLRKQPLMNIPPPPRGKDAKFLQIPLDLIRVYFLPLIGRFENLEIFRRVHARFYNVTSMHIVGQLKIWYPRLTDASGETLIEARLFEEDQMISKSAAKLKYLLSEGDINKLPSERGEFKGRDISMYDEKLLTEACVLKYGSIREMKDKKRSRTDKLQEKRGTKAENRARNIEILRKILKKEGYRNIDLLSGTPEEVKEVNKLLDQANPIDAKDPVVRLIIQMYAKMVAALARSDDFTGLFKILTLEEFKDRINKL